MKKSKRPQYWRMQLHPNKQRLASFYAAQSLAAGFLGLDTIRLRKEGRVYRLTDFPRELSKRWQSRFPDSVEKYGLQDSPITPDGDDYTSRYGPTMFLSRAVPRMFEYAAQTFRELEKTQK